ncbi:MAG TPA: 3-ketoacyl-ACP reductase [Armatimonadota bacterium]|jgi:NAD(P)-dependent dehydrogenase (short-subunit alcohol dehydrogenase family)
MNPVAIVTGSSQGIGRGIALGLADLGYNIVVNFVPPVEPAEETRELLEAKGVECVLAPGSVADAADRQALLAATMNKWGRLDLLVNNAGVGVKTRGDLLETADEADFDRVMAINTKGPYFLSIEAAKLMIDLKKQGIVETPRIAVTSSFSAWVVSTSRGAYCISKAAAHMVAQLLAARLASEGIPVIEIAPCVIDTPMIAPVREKYLKLAADGTIPAGRLGTAEDIAKVVSAFAQGYLDYSTGQQIVVGGGMQIPQL